jgi:hypothetical protein
MFARINAFLLFYKILTKILVLCFFYKIYYLFHIRVLIKKIEIKNNIALDSELKKRIQFYSIFVPVMLGIGFQILNGKYLSKTDKRRLVLASAITPLFDDFFERDNLSVDNLKSFLNTQNFNSYNNGEEELLHLLYAELKPLLIDEVLFLEKSTTVFMAQLQAQKQVEFENLTATELEQITFNKGGYSAQLFWYLNSNDNSEIKAKIVFQLGALIQFADDIFDLWFDLKAGCITIVNKATSIKNLRLGFINQIQFFCKLVFSLEYSENRKILFLEYQLFFISRALVALNQLEKVVMSKSLPFKTNLHTRQELVCDMQKYSNIKSWIKEYYLLINSIKQTK